MNKLAVSLVNKASWLLFPVGTFHCVVSWGLCAVFFQVVFGLNTWCTLLFNWRDTGMHRGMPLQVFVDTREHWALRCWQRRFVGVHSVHSQEKLREQDIVTVRSWMEIWGLFMLKAPSWPGYLILILKSISAVFCPFSLPFFFFLNYKPFHLDE